VCNGKCIKGCCTASDCPLRANSTRSCSASHVCESACKTDFENCDGDLQNGCEVDLRDGQRNGDVVDNCGACGVTCEFSNPWGDCDATQYLRCDDRKCGIQWVTPVVSMCPLTIPHGAIKAHDCSEEGCYYKCEGGWKDCDLEPGNGCETQEGNEPPDTSCSTDYVYYYHPYG
jgi:hypothetical protein